MIHLIISSHKLNLHNYWTGEWLALWTLEKEGDNNYNLKGSLKLNTYYYEEGNVQFNLKRDFTENFKNEKENEHFCQEIIEFIEKSENSVF